MSKKWRTRLSLILCAVLLYSLPEEMNIFVQALGIPMYVRAEEVNNSENNFSESSGSGQSEGQNDSSITYNLAADGTMTISGSGVIPTEKFKNNLEIKSVIIGKDITGIGNNAFFLARNLQSVTFENGSSLTEIGSSAFNGTKITEINLPDSLQTIGKGAFVAAPLTEVVIPASVTSIGEQAFASANNLRNVTFADGSRCTKIENEAFNGCAIESIVIPNGLTTIGNKAFELNKLSQITIPASVTSIGSNPFCGCPLTSIQVDENNPTYEDGDGNAIIDKTTNTLIAGCANTSIQDGVTRIGTNAFKEMNGITSVAIPDSVTSIGANAFDACINLTSVTIPDSVTSIEINAFKLCSALTSITIPEGITSLPDNVVYGCRSLSSITIPNSVTSIGYESFRDCTGLTSITIQGNITSAIHNAFNGCKPTTLIFEDGVNTNTINTIINHTLMITSELEYVVVPDSMLSEVKAMAELTPEVKSKLISRSAYNARYKTPEKHINNFEQHIHNFEPHIVQDVTAYQDGIEELRCSCGAVEGRTIIPAATYIVNGLCGAIKNAPANGTANYDSIWLYCMTDYVIRKLDERKDATIIINFEYNHEKYLMTIPAGRDYTKVLNDESFFYGYFGFASNVPGVTIKKVQ